MFVRFYQFKHIGSYDKIGTVQQIIILKKGAATMSKIYHIKPKDNRKKQKEPLWKYIFVIAIVIFLLMLRDHRIDLSGLYNFILSTKGILNR